MYYTIYKDVSGYWRWNLRAANNEIISMSSEAYTNRRDCEYSIQLNKSSYAAPVRQG